MKQPKSLQPSIYKDCSDLYIWKLSKTRTYEGIRFKIFSAFVGMQDCFIKQFMAIRHAA